MAAGRSDLSDLTIDADMPEDDVLTIFYWHIEPDYEHAWWFDDDWEGPTEET
jgi:hypothetical protein